MTTRLNGGRAANGQPRMLRCLYCGEDWPDEPGFFRYWRGRRIGRKCLACTAEARGHRPPLCSVCLTVRTNEQTGRGGPYVCHGCARRIVGPLTVARLAEYGLVPTSTSSLR